MKALLDTNIVIHRKNTKPTNSFIYAKSFSKRLTLEYLWNNNIVSAPNGPRPFMRINNIQFQDILVQSNTKIKFIKE